MNPRVLNNRSKFYALTLGQVILFSSAIGVVVRVILMFHRETEDTFTLLETIKIFSVGFINDVCLGIILSFFIWLNVALISNDKYRKPFGYIIFSFWTLAFCYTAFTDSIFHQYGGVVPRIAQYFLLYKAISFGLRLFAPKIRPIWSKVSFSVCFFLYILCIFINAVSEYFFWNEFGVRYNFIAVDYLVYTNEVIGNIFESYPIIPLFSVLVILSLFISFFLLKKSLPQLDITQAIWTNIPATFIYFALVALSCYGVKTITEKVISSKIFVNELQANGAYKFYAAFMDSKLDYNTFYPTLSAHELREQVQLVYGTTNSSVKRSVHDSLPEIRKNIVLITVESMSASFLKQYGNSESLTPNLDRLISESLVFDRMYAAGNRTVRGLEAVTLSLPPCPGESLVKQPNNDSLFSTGYMLKQKGYNVQYLYGGDGYFDNMETFFGGNGYEMIDKKKINPTDITFQNIWGVCDEDLFRNAIKVFDNNVLGQQPFFAHVMTVSNHRPFTYPEGKIDIPTNSKSRSGGVKYSDYALGKFFEQAKAKSWFNNTIFVITADHCASSAGKTSIPLDKYHIPALIYAPNFITPQRIDKLVSQIDLMPTVFGLLNLSYESYFYGQNIFSATYQSRAFVATYQNLGYWQDDVLTVLSPTRKVNQYKVVKQEDKLELVSQPEVDSTLLKKAIMYYQTSRSHKISAE
ncbi:MAG: hypothetical protein RL662_254 [Bacteroidota bacterium]|jgi:phosphoglycerol transferase MdoB-like AlkP superfamily enzyme